MENREKRCLPKATWRMWFENSLGTRTESQKWKNIRPITDFLLCIPNPWI
jgi:hypothetical protein